MDNVVIDAGGGVVINAKNVANLKKKGSLVCLWAEPKDILERTKKYSHRPLLKVENPLDKITELMNKRKPYYERADYHLNTSAMDVDEAISAVIKFFSDKK
jgi:shikimate kinase